MNSALHSLRKGRAVVRLGILRGQLPGQRMASTTSETPDLGKLRIGSKYRMLSGYDIPVLGFGVSATLPEFHGYEIMNLLGLGDYPNLYAMKLY